MPNEPEDPKELKRLVQETIAELGIKEEPHPGLQKDEVLAGYIECTNGPEGQVLESFTNAFLLDKEFFGAGLTRLGEREEAEPGELFDYAYPVFAQRSYFYAYIMSHAVPDEV